MTTTFITRCILMVAAGAGLLTGAPGSAHALLLGPTPYLSSADSPFSPFGGYAYFYLEHFEDGLLNTPGVTVSVTTPNTCVTNSPGCFPNSTIVDSVDADDGVIDGNGGLPGHSLFRGLGGTGITFVFDANALGGLPTAVGIVWTDGQNSGTITFQAFDQDGASLGTVSGIHSDADNSGAGSTAEDRFYGATNAGGISSFNIRHPNAGIEVDHLQYGLLTPVNNMPEAGTLSLLVIALSALGFSRRRRSGR